MRRATAAFGDVHVTGVISIHALHEESDKVNVPYRIIPIPISIHALHEESDQPVNGYCRYDAISIHALHEESDNRRYGFAETRCYFNPRSP